MPLAAGTVRDVPVRALKMCGLTWSGQFLWFSEAVSNEIIAIDTCDGTVLHRVPCPEVRTDLTTLRGNLMQIAGGERALRVIDPNSAAVVAEVPNPRPGHVLCGLEATSHGIWLGYEDLGIIDLRSQEDFHLIDSIHVGGSVAGVTVSDSFLVYADYRAATINLVDLDERRELAAYSVAGNPTGLTWDGSKIWYCDHTTLQLRAITVPGLDKS